jgi:hypothetical protein
LRAAELTFGAAGDFGEGVTFLTFVVANGE